MASPPQPKVRYQPLFRGCVQTCTWPSAAPQLRRRAAPRPPCLSPRSRRVVPQCPHAADSSLGGGAAAIQPVGCAPTPTEDPTRKPLPSFLGGIRRPCTDAHGLRARLAYVYVQCSHTLALVYHRHSAPSAVLSPALRFDDTAVLSKTVHSQDANKTPTRRQNKSPRKTSKHPCTF